MLDEKYTKDNKDADIHLRAKKSEKAKLVKAAKKLGIKYTNFILANALAEADKVLAEDK